MNGSAPTNEPFVTKNGPSVIGALLLSFFAIGFSLFGVLGVLDALGIIEFGNRSPRFHALLGSFFILLGMFFTYLTIGALTCWEEVEINRESTHVTKVTFFRKNESISKNADVQSITLLETYEYRTGEVLELILQFKDDESITLMGHESKEKLLAFQKRASQISGIPAKKERIELDTPPSSSSKPIQRPEG